MQFKNISVSGLIVFFAITGILFLANEPHSTLAQANNTNTTSTTNATSTSPGIAIPGTYRVLFTESGGIGGINHIYVYDVLDNRLTFADLKSKTLKSEVLDKSQVQKLESALVSLPSGPQYISSCKVKDCEQFGLIHYGVLPEKLVPISGQVFWQDTTGSKELDNLKNIITNELWKK
jgi:hypothetical protein